MVTIVASRRPNGDERPSRAGYIAAIVVSAVGHAGLFALVFFVAPRFWTPAEAPIPAYSVKIVDNIPAGDLGTHLPRFSHQKREEARRQEPRSIEPKVEPPKVMPPAANDENAIALNTKKIDMPTPTPTPEPEASVAAPTASPAPTPKPRPTPQPAKRVPPKPEVVLALAKPSPTPDVREQLARLKARMLAEHLKDEAKRRAAEEPDEGEGEGEPAASPSTGTRGGGPVVARVATVGKGMGVGSGAGSAGIQQDLDFLLYYRTVQEKIKQAWSFGAGTNDLTATVDFEIGADGGLGGVKIAKSSNDPEPRASLCA